MDFDLQTFDFPQQELPDSLLNNTEIALLTDDFEDTKTIQFMKCGYGIVEYKNEINNQFKLYKKEPYFYFGLSFFNHNNYIYLKAICNEGLNLAMGDYFIILFEDGSKAKFTFSKAGSGNRYTRNNIVPLTSEDFKNFLIKKIQKIKLVSTRQNISEIYTITPPEIDNKFFKYQYNSKEEAQLLFQYMTYLFIDFNIKNPITTS